jgi:hypothetical protein
MSENSTQFEEYVHVIERFRRDGNAFASDEYHASLASIAKKEKSTRTSRAPSSPLTPSPLAEELRLVPDDRHTEVPTQRESQETTKDLKYHDALYPGVSNADGYATIDLTKHSIADINTTPLHSKKSTKFLGIFPRKKETDTPDDSINAKAAKFLGEESVSGKKITSSFGKETFRALTSSSRRVTDHPDVNSDLHGMDWNCKGLPYPPGVPSNAEIQRAHAMSVVELSNTAPHPPLGQRSFTDTPTPTLKTLKSMKSMRGISAIGELFSSKIIFYSNSILPPY